MTGLGHADTHSYTCDAHDALPGQGPCQPASSCPALRSSALSYGDGGFDSALLQIFWSYGVQAPRFCLSLCATCSPSLKSVSNVPPVRLVVRIQRPLLPSSLKRRGKRKKMRDPMEKSYAVASCWVMTGVSVIEALSRRHEEHKSEHRSEHPMQSGTTDRRPLLGVFIWIEIAIPLNRDTCHVHFMLPTEIQREIVLLIEPIDAHAIRAFPAADRGEAGGDGIENQYTAVSRTCYSVNLAK